MTEIDFFFVRSLIITVSLGIKFPAHIAIPWNLSSVTMQTDNSYPTNTASYMLGEFETN
jgi:hypothetical protein